MDCENVRNYMAEYIGQALDVRTKEEIGHHLDKCSSCFNEIKKLDNVTWKLECDSRSIKVPADFLQGMEEKAVCDIKPHIRIPSWSIKTAIAAFTIAVIVISFIVFVPQNFKYRLYNAATFGKVYSTEYGAFGRRLNISSTSNNIKITVTKVAADDLRTLIYLKMEGSAANGCVIDNGDIFINGNMEDDATCGPLENTDSYSSVLILDPIEAGSQTLHVTIKGLHRIADRSDERVGGTWSFAVPVEKLKSRVYNIDRTVDLGEDKVYFKRLTVGSTCTRMEYYFPDRDNVLNISILEIEAINGQKKYSAVAISSGGNGKYDTADFETIYPDNPEDFKVNIKEYYKSTTLKDYIAVTVNLKGKFPVEFDYMGNTIKIDNMKVNGSKAQFVIYEPDRPRNYTDLSIHTDSDVFMSMDSRDYIAVDENNKVYDYDDYLKNSQKYDGKSIIAYPVKTAISIEYPPGFKNYFKLYVSGSQNIIRANKTITLK